MMILISLIAWVVIAVSIGVLINFVIYMAEELIDIIKNKRK